MYGSVIRLRARPETGERLLEAVNTLKAGIAKGGPTDLSLYRLDASDDWVLVVASYATKGVYLDVVAALERMDDYNRLLVLLRAPPAWEHGEIVYREELAYNGL